MRKWLLSSSAEPSPNTKHLFFCCDFHDAARAILFNRVYNILTNNISPEFFDCLSSVELLRIF